MRHFALDTLKLRGDGGLLALDSLCCSLVRVGCAVNGIIADCFHVTRMILSSGGMRQSALATTDEEYQISLSAEHSMEGLRFSFTALLDLPRIAFIAADDGIGNASCSGQN